MNHVVFTTGGDWDSTTLANNNQEVLACQLFVQLVAGRDDWGNPCDGGLADGGEMVAYVRTQDDPGREIGLFPGRVELNSPGHQLFVENTHPAFAIEFTRVWYNGREVTDQVVELYYDVNADENEVKAYLTLYRAHWLSADEVATYNIL